MRFFRVIAASFLLLIVMPLLVLASDKIELTSGKALEGSFAGSSGNSIRVQMPGGTITLSAASIRSINGVPINQFLSNMPEARGARLSAEPTDLPEPSSLPSSQPSTESYISINDEEVPLRSCFAAFKPETGKLDVILFPYAVHVDQKHMDFIRQMRSIGAVKSYPGIKIPRSQPDVSLSLTFPIDSKTGRLDNLKGGFLLFGQGSGFSDLSKIGLEKLFVELKDNGSLNGVLKGSQNVTVKGKSAKLEWDIVLDTKILVFEKRKQQEETSIETVQASVAEWFENTKKTVKIPEFGTRIELDKSVDQLDVEAEKMTVKQLEAHAKAYAKEIKKKESESLNKDAKPSASEASAAERELKELTTRLNIYSEKLRRQGNEVPVVS